MKSVKYITLYLISFFIRHFFKVNANLLVFSSRGGVGFEDNSKYLFLYTLHNTDYECLWITKKKMLLEELKSAGYNVKYYFTLAALFEVLRAKAIFFTHATSDVMPMFYNKATKRINLWHGTPIKKIALMDKKLGVIIKFKYKIYKFFYTYFISNSEYYNKFYKEVFGLDNSKIKPFGLPRIDFLKDTNKFGNEFKNPFDPSLTNYLYAPTFRDYEFSNPLLKENALREIDELLSSKKAKLYLKFHPLDYIPDISNYHNIFLLKNKDIYEALPFIDGLITDYSSLLIDYMCAYPDRKISLYVPDLDEYRKERDFLFDYEDIFGKLMVKKYQDIVPIYNASSCMENIDRNMFYNDKVNACDMILSLLN